MSIPKSKFHSRIPKKEDKNKISLADQAEEELKRANPEKYYELINSIKDTLAQEKQTPGYVKEVFANQMNLIDPVFILPEEDDDPNKLRLIMDG